tara:strand:- start:122 stop:283 length:162 start_codon:yes stop_codon:yes gene_type:complete
MEGSVVCRVHRKFFRRIARKMGVAKIIIADVAQLAEQLICNQQVVGSNPSVGS